MNDEYNIEEINRELWDICEDFKEETDIKKEYIIYISALLYIIYYKNDYFNILNYLYKESKNFYIAKEIDGILQNIENKYLFKNIQFKGIIIYRSLGNVSIITKTIERIYNLIKYIENRFGNSKKYIAKAYEYILIQSMAKQDINIGDREIYTPTSIVKTIISCLKTSQGYGKIIDPYCGSGNFLINIPQNEDGQIYGMEENQNAYNICMTNLMLHDIDQQKIELNDFEEKNYRNIKFDYIISNPPFIGRSIKTKSIYNQKISYGYSEGKIGTGDYSYVFKMIDMLQHGGKIAVILPHGVLFRESEKRDRLKLLKDNMIDAIIGLPANMFYGTKISVIIMILKKNKPNRDILFIDASNEYKSNRKINTLSQEDQDRIVNAYLQRKDITDYSHVATIDEIIDNDYNLTIKRYIKKEKKKKEIRLEELVENIQILENERNILEDNIKDVLERINTILTSKEKKEQENIYPQEKEQEFPTVYLKYHGVIYAKGIMKKDKFIILKGSKINDYIFESLSDSLLGKVLEVRESNNVVDGVFIDDYECNSPSIAATIILGRNANGWTEWKDEEGRTLKEIKDRKYR